MHFNAKEVGLVPHVYRVNRNGFALLVVRVRLRQYFVIGFFLLSGFPTEELACVYSAVDLLILFLLGLLICFKLLTGCLLAGTH
jgi:hypothetical protein